MSKRFHLISLMLIFLYLLARRINLAKAFYLETLTLAYSSSNEVVNNIPPPY